CTREWNGKLTSTRSLPPGEVARAARPLKVSSSGEALLISALACFTVNTSAADPSRVHVALKNTAWIGLVNSIGGVTPETEGTTGEVISKIDTNPAAGSEKNGSSAPEAARASGSPSCAVAGVPVTSTKHVRSSPIENRIRFLMFLVRPRTWRP